MLKELLYITKERQNIMMQAIMKGQFTTLFWLSLILTILRNMPGKLMISVLHT